MDRSKDAKKSNLKTITLPDLLTDDKKVRELTPEEKKWMEEIEYGTSDELVKKSDVHKDQ